MNLAELFAFLSAHSGFLAALAALLSTLAVWWLSRYFLPRNEGRKMWQRVDGLTERVAGLEDGRAEIMARLSRLPLGRDVEGLRLDIKSVQGKQDALATRLDGLSLCMSSLEKHTLLMTQRLMEGRGNV